MTERTPPASTTSPVGGTAPFEFDRYINGKLMAEGVTIERQPDLQSAMRKAVAIASKGPNGEQPVLVYRPPPAATDSAGASLPAMKAAVELEIMNAIGAVTTRAIGEIVQKAIDAAHPARGPDREAIARIEPHLWKYVRKGGSHPAQPENLMLATATIHISDHMNAIQFHHRIQEAAEARRDYVLQSILDLLNAEAK